MQERLRARIARLAEELTSPGDTATLLRRGVLALAFLGIAGTGVELVFLRHWTSALRLIVWPTLLVLILGAWLLARGPSARAVRRVRWMSLGVVLVAGLGMALHVHANVEAGPLSEVYGARWASMPVIQQWFLATTGGVGPAPTLAPGALAEIALALLLATVRHPALRADTTAGGAAAVSPD